MTNIDQLTKLADLHKSGTLTDEEFSQQKAMLLAGQGLPEPSSSRSRSLLVVAAVVVVAAIGGVVYWMSAGADTPTEAEAFAAYVKQVDKPLDDLGFLIEGMASYDPATGGVDELPELKDYDDLAARVRKLEPENRAVARANDELVDRIRAARETNRSYRDAIQSIEDAVNGGEGDYSLRNQMVEYADEYESSTTTHVDLMEKLAAETDTDIDDLDLHADVPTSGLFTDY